MPRRHALQSRPGTARGIHVRLTDDEHRRLARLAKRREAPTTVSAVVRDAIQAHILTSDGSPFFSVFGRLIEDLANVDVRPILVGSWAAAAHGYISPQSSLELAVRTDELPSLRSFLTARGARSEGSLPLVFGREPWRVSFASSFGERAAEELPTVAFGWGAASLDTLTLEGLLELGRASLEEHVFDALHELRAGTHHLDDGERGAVAWDAAGRLTASAWYPDPLTRAPFRFIDFRISE